MDARNLVHEIMERLSSLSDLREPFNITEIKSHLSNVKEVVKPEHNSNNQNPTLLGLVKVLVNDLSDLEKDLPPSSSSSAGTRQNSKNDDYTKIKDVACRLNGLVEYSKLSSPDSARKQCVDYCSLFPKDYEFDVPQLINLWAAEGYFDSEEEEPETGGQKYVHEFRSKSFFEDADEDERERIVTCKMYSQIHSLAALNTKVNDTLRQVSFHHGLDIPDSLLNKAKDLRTILFPAFTRSRLPYEEMISTSTCERIFSRFKQLRVLDFHNLGIKVLPPSIGDLKYLEYLDLSENNIDRLPPSITKLTNLKTLKLSHCYRLKELPKDLKQLKSLRHLEIEGCLDLTHMPQGMKQMTSLRTLSHFVVSNSHPKGGLGELDGLNKLTEVEILHLEQLKCMPSNNQSQQEFYLRKNTQLEVLTLRWDHDNVSRNKSSESSEEDPNASSQLQCVWPHNKLKVFFIVGYLGKFDGYGLSSFNCLVKFSLYNCPSCTYIPPLHGLPKLKVLKLQRLDSLKYIYKDGSEGSFSSHGKFFESLKELSLCDCPELTSWWQAAETKATFGKISKLEIRYCPKLTRMPLFTDLDRQLILVSSSGEPLDRTLKGGESPLSKLKSVQIANVKKESPEEWIKEFNSLEELCIREYPLESLAHGLTELTSVTIENCTTLDLSDNALQGLGKLRRLTLRGIPKLKSFPSKLEGLTCLKDLELHSCHELTSLPASICKLESLSMLELSECHKLASLPNEIGKLKNLETLIIRDCPLLLPRCQRETGDDWLNISHIKKIILTQTSQGF